MAVIKEFPDVGGERENNIARELAEKNRHTADDLRRIASDVEDGATVGLMVVTLNGDGTIYHYASFEDRFAMIGALEYAKTNMGLE